MKLTGMPEAVIDWSKAPTTRVPGAGGFADSRASQVGEVQQRIVAYSPGYLADHWCSKGHVLYVLQGVLNIEHENSALSYQLSLGMSWHVSDGDAPAHRVRSENGAVVFIVD